jgi:hypothetical protein
MAEDALESILRMVSDGRLTAEEAGPIIDALEAGGATHDDRRARTDPASGSAAPPAGGPGRALRVEVTEAGRKVVNLRVPLALGRAALQRVPGLSEATNDRIRDAIESGLTGPIVAVDDADGDGVRILIE